MQASGLAFWYSGENDGHQQDSRRGPAVCGRTRARRDDQVLRRRAGELARRAGGLWLRVSSGGQDEANQLPDVLGHCAGHGYRPAVWYVQHDKSASKGEQQDEQDKAVEDMREGVIKPLVCWDSDRVERRGPEALFRFLRRIKDAGGRLESTTEPLLGTEDLSGEAVTALNAVIAHQKSVHLAEQVKLGHDRIRAGNGLMPGGIPWGYKVTGEKYHKTMIPDEAFIREVDGKPKHYAADIFEHCIAGDSCRTIAIWLDAEGVKPVRGSQWNERSVWQIIRNMAYAGRRQDEGDLRENRKGKLVPSRKNRRTIMNVEAVVTMDMWQRANDALRGRPGRGPGVNGVLQPKPLLEKLNCARCEDSPMYRLRKYYRCFGKGTRRKGCGNMVPLAQTDFIVAERVIAVSTEPYVTRAWVEGESYDDAIANTKQDLREAVEAEHWADMPALQEKLDELRDRQAHATKGHYEKTYYRRSDGSAVREGEHLQHLDELLTEGDHFETLDVGGRRAYLATRDIRVEKVLNPEPGASCGLHVVIDGIDHGVFPYPPARA